MHSNVRIQAYSTAPQTTPPALQKAAIGAGVAGVALLLIGGIAALNQRFSLIPLSPLAQRCTLIAPLAVGGLAVAFSGGTLFYTSNKSKKSVSTDQRPKAADQPLPLESLPPPPKSRLIFAPPPSAYETHKLDDRRERRLVLGPDDVQESMAKNLRLAMESQRKERPINTKPNSFMTPLETVGFDGKLAESELEQLKKDKLVPVYQDVQITRNCDRRCYFAMSPLLTEGRLQIGAAHTKGSRQFMEDRHLSSANLMLPFPSGDEHALLAGVFDGHGGEEFANYLADHLPQYFLAQFNAMKTKSHDRDVIIYNALKQAIVMAGRDCDRDRFLLSGATVACSLIIGDTLYVANLGDSRTIYLPVSGAPIQLSDDAKETPRFTKRVVNRGGVVLHRAVGGQIRCFGACGDLALKTDRDVPIMPQRAQITTHKIAPGGTLIIASDGLWDVATTEEVAAITSEIRSRIPANKIALNIVQRAFLARSQDNITVVVINV